MNEEKTFEDWEVIFFTIGQIKGLIKIIEIESGVNHYNKFDFKRLEEIGRKLREEN